MPDSGSDSDSGSDYDDESELRKAFPTYNLQKQAIPDNGLFVFDRQDGGGGSQNNSSSADRQTTGTIQDKIKSALLSADICVSDYFWDLCVIIQFWAPVENGGRQILSTSGQPFAVNNLDDQFIKYRHWCTECEYDIADVNYRRQEDEQSNNPSGPPATAFLNRLPQIVDFSKDTRGGTLAPYEYASIMLPICCCPSQTSSPCVGVIEFTIYEYVLSRDFEWINEALKEVGLSIFDVQERIPYKTLHGLEPARDQIRDAIEIVCKSHKLILAQVWIAYHEDKNQVPFLSSFEYTQKKHMLALKLTGYINSLSKYPDCYLVKNYYSLCDIVPLDTGESLVEKTLQDYTSRFCKTFDRLNKNQKSLTYYCTGVNGIVIWLRSIDTGDFGYAFEFLWNNKIHYDLSLEDLLLALKGHLPSFKFASGAELGDELHVIDVENSTESDIRSFKIFKGKGESSMPEALEEGKKQVVVKDITHLEMNCESAPIDIHGEDIELQFEKTQKEVAKKLTDVGNSIKRDSKRKKPAVVEGEECLKAKQKTAPIELPKAGIVKRFGKTQREAAKDLNVSLSTLKRKCKEYGIYEWQGPLKPGKKMVNHFRNQSGTIEEDTGAILVPSALERIENNLTIKAEDSNDMIRFELPMSEVTFKSVEKEIVKEFELIPGTYKIKYCDKEEEWILLTPNCDMNYCIRSSKDSHKNIIRLRVQRVSPSS